MDGRTVGGRRGHMENEGQIVFRDTSGRELTVQDLAGSTGSVAWEIVGAEAVPAEARALHKQGRAAGSAGDQTRALALFEQAQTLAPQWPYPSYDAAFTYLMKGDAAKALELYERVDQMAPRGFFTSKTSLQTLRRERDGRLPPGFARSFATLEWMEDRAQKAAVLRQLTERFPDFAPAWKELASLLTDPEQRLAAIEAGLAADPDAETQTMLLLNKAALLNQCGDRNTAIAILGSMALDPDATLSAHTLAKFMLAQMLRTR